MPLKYALGLSLIFFILASAQAQTDAPSGSTFSVETRLTNLIQGGYELGVFRNTSGPFSFGLQFAAQNIEGGTRDLLFESSDYEQLNVRLTWLFAAKARYHFRAHQEGFYAEISTGYEQFSVAAGNSPTQRNENAFLLPSLGYLWHPWGRSGLYVNPNVGYIYAFGRAAERTVAGTTYELRPFFPSAALSVGWRF